jgi:hypothetical protein
VSVTAAANTGLGRSGTVTFSAAGVSSRRVVVTQALGSEIVGLPLEVIAPETEWAQAGSTLVKVFTLENPNAFEVNVSLVPTVDQAGWTAALLGAASLSVPSLGSVDVPVEVVVAAGAASGESCELRLSATAPAGVSDAVVSLVATWNAVEVSPLLAQFGEVPLGFAARQTLRFFNHGDSAVTLGTVVLSGLGYSLSNDLVSGAEIPAGESRSLELVLDPQGLGYAAATLTWSVSGPLAEALTSRALGQGVPYPSPEKPEPVEPVVLEYAHALASNTVRMNLWDLDPDGLLGGASIWTVEGALPSGLRIRDGWLTGVFAKTGPCSFVLRCETAEVILIHRFSIRVLEPVVCPTILGLAVNGVLHPVEVLVESGHAQAAQTATLELEVGLGEALELLPDWDFIKGDFSWRVLDGALPSGLVLDGASGVIRGVPLVAGDSRFLLSVKDWRGRGYQWVRLVVVE